MKILQTFNINNKTPPSGLQWLVLHGGVHIIETFILWKINVT